MVLGDLPLPPQLERLERHRLQVPRRQYGTIFEGRAGGIDAGRGRRAGAGLQLASRPASRASAPSAPRDRRRAGLRRDRAPAGAGSSRLHGVPPTGTVVGASRAAGRRTATRPGATRHVRRASRATATATRPRARATACTRSSPQLRAMVAPGPAARRHGDDRRARAPQHRLRPKAEPAEPRHGRRAGAAARARRRGRRPGRWAGVGLAHHSTRVSTDAAGSAETRLRLVVQPHACGPASAASRACCPPARRRSVGVRPRVTAVALGRGRPRRAAPVRVTRHGATAQAHGDAERRSGARRAGASCACRGAPCAARRATCGDALRVTPAGRLPRAAVGGGRHAQPLRPLGRRSRSAVARSERTPPAAAASRPSRRGTGPCRSAAAAPCAARMRRSSRSDQCSMYQRSSSMRSCHGSAARPLHLRPAGDARLDRQPPELARRVLRDLRLHGRARADQAHVAAQHVDQVRQLVQREAPQQRADARDARIALVDRQPRSHALGARSPSCAASEVELARRPSRRGAGGRSASPRLSSLIAAQASASNGDASTSSTARGRRRARA